MGLGHRHTKPDAQGNSRGVALEMIVPLTWTVLEVEKELQRLPPLTLAIRFDA